MSSSAAWLADFLLRCERWHSVYQGWRRPLLVYDGLPAAQQAQAQANLIANANYLLGQAETAFSTTTGWFNVAAGKFGPSHRQQILLDQPFNKGAFNTGYGNPIHVDGQVSNGNVATGGPIVAMLWMASRSAARCSCSSTGTTTTTTPGATRSSYRTG